MYSLYGHPRYIKFKRKYQKYGPCFQFIFPFYVTMLELTIDTLQETVNDLKSENKKRKT